MHMPCLLDGTSNQVYGGDLFHGQGFVSSSLSLSLSLSLSFYTQGPEILDKYIGASEQIVRSYVLMSTMKSSYSLFLI